MQTSTDPRPKPNILVEGLALESARRAIKTLADKYRTSNHADPLARGETVEALDRIGELLSADYNAEKRHVLQSGFRFGAATTLIVMGFLALTAGLCCLKIDETTTSIE